MIDNFTKDLNVIRRIKLFRYHYILMKALYEKISDLINYPFIGSKIVVVRKKNFLYRQIIYL